MSEIINVLRDLTAPRYTEKKYQETDRAINAVCICGLVDSYEEFENILIEVILLVQKYVIKSQNPVEGGREYYLHTAVRILNKKLGPSSLHAAMEMARTGKEGGIYAVIKLVANGYTDELFENEAMAKVGILFVQMSNDDKFAVMDEYIKEFGHLWPDELIENGALRLKINFLKTLHLHIENIRKLTKSVDS